MHTGHKPLQPRRRAGEMFPVIARYLESDLTQEAFCRQENLAIHVFHYWLKKYRQQQKPAKPDAPGSPAFLPIQLAGVSAHGPSACEIALPNGIVVRFGHPLKPGHLGQIISAIGG